MAHDRRHARARHLYQHSADDRAMAQRPRTDDDAGMEGLAPVVVIVVGFAGVVGGVLWAIAAMTGGAGEQRQRQ